MCCWVVLVSTIHVERLVTELSELEELYVAALRAAPEAVRESFGCCGACGSPGHPTAACPRGRKVPHQPSLPEPLRPQAVALSDGQQPAATAAAEPKRCDHSASPPPLAIHTPFPSIHIPWLHHHMYA